MSTVTEQFVPEYDRWRHGGWYVSNVHYPSGAVGCVSRNYPDRKWRVVCAGQDEITYASRDAAALAEKRMADAELANAGNCDSCGAHIGPSQSQPWHWEGEPCRAVRQVQMDGKSPTS